MVRTRSGLGAAVPTRHGSGPPSMAKHDFYELLGVGKTATESELKSAFRKAALQCHPDRNPGDKNAEAKFKEINEAYQCLSDGQKRAAYDRFGHAAFQGGNGAGMGDGFSSSMADIFDDLFGDMMGRSRGRSGGRERGSDLRYNLEITLEEAYKGKTATVKMPISVACDHCTGSGAKPGSKPSHLHDLRGPGPRAGPAGLLRHRADLSGLRRPWRGHRQSLPGLRRHRTRYARTCPVGQRAGRRRGRYADSARWRGGGGPAWRPGRGPLHLPGRQAAPILSARRRRPLLPRADLVHPGGAWWRLQRADARRQRRTR